MGGRERRRKGRERRGKDRGGKGEGGRAGRHGGMEDYGGQIRRRCEGDGSCSGQVSEDARCDGGEGEGEEGTLRRRGGGGNLKLIQVARSALQTLGLGEIVQLFGCGGKREKPHCGCGPLDRVGMEVHLVSPPEDCESPREQREGGGGRHGSPWATEGRGGDAEGVRGGGGSGCPSPGARHWCDATRSGERVSKHRMPPCCRCRRTRRGRHARRGV